MTQDDEQTSIWNELFGIRFGPDCDPRIPKLVSMERPVAVAGRQSAARSWETYDDVCADVEEAVAALRSELHVDLVRHLPPRDVMVRALRVQRPRVSRLFGFPDETFETTMAIVDLRPAGCAAILVLSVGSSTMTDHDTRTQPTVDNLTGMVNDFLPCLVFARRQDRLFRQGWGQGPFRELIRLLRESMGIVVLVADAEEGFTAETPLAQGEALVRGAKDFTEAKNLFKKTRDRMLSKTTTNPVMHDGVVDGYHVGGHMSTGLTRFDTYGADRKLRKAIYLDCPAIFPPEADILGLSPYVYLDDEEAKPACHICSLAFFMDNVGILSKRDIGYEMIDRRFSSDQLRRTWKIRGMYWGMVPEGATNEQLKTIARHPYELQRAIGRARGILRTGELVTTRASETITVTNIIPTGTGCACAERGYIGTPDDWDRFEWYLSVFSKDRSAPKSFTFEGFPLPVNGKPRVMVPMLIPPEQPPGPPRVRYMLVQPDRQPGEHMERTYVDHEPWALSVFQGFVDAQHIALPRVSAAKNDEQTTRMRRDIEDKERTRSDLLRQAELLREDSIDRASDGTYTYTADRRKEMDREREKIENEDSERVRAIGAARVGLAEHIRRVEERTRGLQVGLAADVLRSLLDPHDMTYRSYWFDSLDDMQATTSQPSRSNTPGKVVEWKGSQRASDGSVTVSIPIVGRQHNGLVDFDDVLAEQRLAGLRRGVPIATSIARDSKVTGRVCERLGLQRNQGAFLLCPDPDLLAFGMAVLAREDGAEPRRPDSLEGIPQDLLQAATSTFLRPDRLAARLRARHLPPNAHAAWFCRHARSEVVAILAAANNGGLVDRNVLPDKALNAFRVRMHESPEMQQRWDRVRPGVFRLRPCPWCGSLLLAPSRHCEPDGAICLDCHLDRSEILWRAPLFDRYLIAPELWTSAGHRLELDNSSLTQMPGAFGLRLSVVRGVQPTRQGRPRVTRFRDVTTMTAMETQDLIAEYCDRASLEYVAAAHGIRMNAAREILEAAGVLRHAPPPNRLSTSRTD